MNLKRFILSIIFAFIFINIYEWLVHGVILKDAYLELSHLWHSFSHMKEFFSWSVLSQLIFAIAMSAFFVSNYEGKGLFEGLRFGSFIGLIMGSTELSSFVYIPVSVALSLVWTITILVECIGIGLILALTYRE